MSNDKNVLWQAFLVAGAIFITGIFLGTLFEQSRADEIGDLYLNAEIDLLDIQLQNEILSSFEFDCDLSINESRDFADRIFSEALLLEKYDKANKITNSIIGLHKEYDLLRVSLWKNLILIREKCGDRFDTIVYLYDYENTPLNLEAKQSAFRNILLDVKERYGDRVILIPIAYDTGVKSLDLLRKKYGLEEVPVVFVNEDIKLTDLLSSEDIERHLLR